MKITDLAPTGGCSLDHQVLVTRGSLMLPLRGFLRSNLAGPQHIPQNTSAELELLEQEAGTSPLHVTGGVRGIFEDHKYMVHIYINYMCRETDKNFSVFGEPDE